jgi:hypothetical protein
VLILSTQDELLATALKKFTNIDGAYGRKTIPLPHTTFHNPSSIPLDSQSAQDRIDEIALSLSPQERAVLEASILLARWNPRHNLIPRIHALVGNVRLHVPRLA